MEELLVLIPPIELLDNLAALDKERIELVMGGCMNWLNCCAAMEKEPAFSPSHSFTSLATRSKLHLFHLKEDDLFMLFRLSLEGDLIGLSLVSREENLLKQGIHSLVAQKLTNYLLNYLWFAI